MVSVKKKRGRRLNLRSEQIDHGLKQKGAELVRPSHLKKRGQGGLASARGG